MVLVVLLLVCGYYSRSKTRVQQRCPPDIRYSDPPALVFLHASSVKHCSPAGETEAGAGCVCHPVQVLGLAALVTAVNQAEPLGDRIL